MEGYIIREHYSNYENGKEFTAYTDNFEFIVYKKYSEALGRLQRLKEEKIKEADMLKDLLQKSQVCVQAELTRTSIKDSLYLRYDFGNGDEAYFEYWITDIAIV